MPVALRGGDGNDLRMRAWLAQLHAGGGWQGKPRSKRRERDRSIAVSQSYAKQNCQWHAGSPLSFPQVSEKRNGNTVLSPKPTDGTKRSQTEWSGTDCPEQATCSGETLEPLN